MKMQNSDTIKKKGRPKCFCRYDALEQAMGLFCEKGYEATSVAQLGKAMNMKPPSLYNAFGDKEKLFLEVLDQYHKPYEETVEKLFQEDVPTVVAMKNLILVAKGFHVQKNPVGCLVVNSAINVDAQGSAIASKIKAIHDKNDEMVYQRLAKGVADGDIPQTVNIRRLTRYISGVLQGAAALARGQQSPEAVKDFLTEASESVADKLSFNA